MDFTINLSTFKIDFQCKHIENNRFLYLYEGWIHEDRLDTILIQDINKLKNCSGEFFAVKIDKTDKTVHIVNDKKCSFLIFYNTEQNIISTKLSDFQHKLDIEWCQNAFDRHRVDSFSNHDLDLKCFKKRYINKHNNYLSTHTYYVPPRCEVFFSQNNTRLNEYASIDKMFKPIAINSKKDLIDFVEKRLQTNIGRIYESYSEDKILFGSTGLDSLTMLSMLMEKNRQFSMLNYFFEE